MTFCQHNCRVTHFTELFFGLFKQSCPTDRALSNKAFDTKSFVQPYISECLQEHSQKLIFLENEK